MLRTSAKQRAAAVAEQCVMVLPQAMQLHRHRDSKRTISGSSNSQGNDSEGSGTSSERGGSMSEWVAGHWTKFLHCQWLGLASFTQDLHKKGFVCARRACAWTWLGSGQELP